MSRNVIWLPFSPFRVNIRDMENQIQLYHDFTAFWLERDWKTPREKQLERQVTQLRQENQELKAEVEAFQVDVDYFGCSFLSQATQLRARGGTIEPV